jgi:carbamoyl-phosphate synthase small subunit
MKKIYLVMEDGHSFEGYSFGATAEVCGELVFNTGMVGYIEELTDPAYYGQILVKTFPMVGNYGIISEDFENKCSVKALVVREWCDTPSNFRCEYDLDKFLKDNGVVGVCGIDTREITKYLRENGTMNAKICFSIPESLEDVKSYEIKNAVAAVSCDAPTSYSANGDVKYSVTVVDYGIKKSFIDELCKRGCNVKVVPANTSAEDILADKPDGVMLSGGPGNPADATECVAEIAKLMGNVPMFGIGLGHQLMAIAAGAETVKLKYGHRGGNQPSHKVGTNRTYITSQNNGYAVVADKLTKGTVSFVNANDNTCEGIEYPELRAFSVQFYPESIAGLHSTSFLYDQFIEMMGGN